MISNSDLANHVGVVHNTRHEGVHLRVNRLPLIFHVTIPGIGVKET